MAQSRGNIYSAPINIGDSATAILGDVVGKNVILQIGQATIIVQQLPEHVVSRQEQSGRFQEAREVNGDEAIDQLCNVLERLSLRDGPSKVRQSPKHFGRQSTLNASPTRQEFRISAAQCSSWTREIANTRSDVFAPLSPPVQYGPFEWPEKVLKCAHAFGTIITIDCEGLEWLGEWTNNSFRNSINSLTDVLDAIENSQNPTFALTVLQNIEFGRPSLITLIELVHLLLHPGWSVRSQISANLYRYLFFTAASQLGRQHPFCLIIQLCARVTSFQQQVDLLTLFLNFLIDVCSGKVPTPLHVSEADVMLQLTLSLTGTIFTSIWTQAGRYETLEVLLDLVPQSECISIAGNRNLALLIRGQIEGWLARAYVQAGKLTQAIEVYNRLRIQNVPPETFPRRYEFMRGWAVVSLGVLELRFDLVPGRLGELHIIDGYKLMAYHSGETSEDFLYIFRYTVLTLRLFKCEDVIHRLFQIFPEASKIIGRGYMGGFEDDQELELLAEGQPINDDVIQGIYRAEEPADSKRHVEHKVFHEGGRELHTSKSPV